MYLTTMTMEDRLLAAKVAITNALADDEIKERLLFLGFNEERLNSGKELLNKTESLFQQQKDEYSEQYQANQDMHRAWKKSKITFRMYSTDVTKNSKTSFVASKEVKIRSKRRIG